MPPRYKGYPWQDRVHQSKARFKIIQAGRRAGKGRMALQETLSLIEEASTTPIYNDKGIIDPDRLDNLVPPIHVWTLAPTYSQAKQAWNEMKAFVPDNLVRKKFKNRAGGRGGGWNEDDMEVWLDFKDENGNWLDRYRRSVYWQIRSADNYESLQTVGLDFLWMTEAQDTREEAWNKVRPTLSSQDRFGRAVIEGIPPLSAAHWFAKLFKAAQNDESGRMEAFHASTFDNPALSEDQKEAIKDELKTTTESIWRRHYLAEQQAGAGGFFRRIDECSTAMEITHPVEGHKYVGGLDIGVKDDETVFIIKDRKLRCSVSAIVFSRRDWTLQREAIVAEAERWNLDEIVMDATGLGGNVAYNDLSAAGLPLRALKFTNHSKYNMWREYAVALEKSTVTFPAHWQKLVSQLQAADIKDSGAYYTFRQIDNGHDDWLDAEIMALMACDPAEEDVNFSDIAYSVPGVPSLRPPHLRSKRSIPYLQRYRQHKSDIKRKEWEQAVPELSEELNGNVTIKR